MNYVVLIVFLAGLTLIVPGSSQVIQPPEPVITPVPEEIALIPVNAETQKQLDELSASVAKVINKLENKHKPASSSFRSKKNKDGIYGIP